MLITQIVDLMEGIRPQYFYHGTSFKNLASIVNDGFIYPNEPNWDADKKDGRDYISLTRDVSFGKGYDVNITVDPFFLKHTIKTQPFDFFGDTEDSRRKEREERVFQPIPVNSKIIKRIDMYVGTYETTDDFGRRLPINELHERLKNWFDYKCPGIGQKLAEKGIVVGCRNYSQYMLNSEIKEMLNSIQLN